jgi:WD40 repeat protein
MARRESLLTSQPWSGIHSQSMLYDFVQKVCSTTFFEFGSANYLGEMLASAGDDGNVILWVPSEAPMTTLGDEHIEDKEAWRVKHMCRSSTGAEIYDLAWSPDGVFFITGGVDNTARIFNAQTGMLLYGLKPSSSDPK